MLSYLFQNGPELCAIAQEPAAECCPELLERLDGVASALNAVASPRLSDLWSLYHTFDPAESTFDVPDGRALIVTAVFLNGGREVTIEEEIDGVRVLKFRASGPNSTGEPSKLFSSSTGIPFSPGARVVIGGDGEATITGYLVDTE
jgi:hypothetical protein